MKTVLKVGIFLLLVIVLSLTSSSSALSNPYPQEPPPPPELQLAPKRPAPLNPPSPRTGFIPPSIDLSHLTGQRMPAGVMAQDLPSSFDWRTEGKVTSVKNQGACGSCYAFAAIGNFESKMLMDGAYTLPDPDFSENNAKECNWREVNDYVDIWGNWGGCDGGNYYMLASLFSQKGVVLESCDQYQATDVGCNSSCAYQQTLLDWRIISEDAVPNTDALKGYIQTYGPVYTSLYVGSGPGDPWYDEFAAYDGSYTLNYTGSVMPTNHAVLIVGWNDSPTYTVGSDDSPTQAAGTGGWIVKNSWGTGWGGPCGYGTEGGYFTIAYGSASIGMYSSFMYGWQVYDASGGIMYYDDDGGSENAFGCGNTTAWGLAKFIPSSNTNVTRVEFWTLDVTTDVDVYIYDDFNGTTLSNELRRVENNSFNEAGYHSVAVAPLPVTSGNDIIAVVKLTNSSFQYPVPLDPNGPIQTNRTYVSCNGSSGSWLETGGSGFDVAIRLRTSTAPPPSPTPTPTPPPAGYNIYLPLAPKNLQ